MYVAMQLSRPESTYNPESLNILCNLCKIKVGCLKTTIGLSTNSGGYRIWLYMRVGTVEGVTQNPESPAYSVKGNYDVDIKEWCQQATK